MLPTGSICKIIYKSRLCVISTVATLPSKVKFFLHATL